MPATPGTSAQKEIDPSIHHQNPDRTDDPVNPISSVTHDPFEGIGPQVQTTGSDVKTMYQGDVVVGRLAMGCGTLNPAAAIELQAA